MQKERVLRSCTLRKHLFTLHISPLQLGPILGKLLPKCISSSVNLVVKPILYFQSFFQAPYIHIFLDRSRSGARVKRNAGYCKVGPESSSRDVVAGQQQSLNTIPGATGALSLPPRDEIEECCVYHLKVDFKKVGN